MKIMLDSSVCIAAMRGHAGAKAHLSQYRAGDCVVSTIVVFELFVGVEKASVSQAERVKVDRLLATLTVVTFDKIAAEFAARVMAALEKMGKRCGPYDMLIAGHSLALSLPLATNNVREFSRVSGLQVQDWLA